LPAGKLRSCVSTFSPRSVRGRLTLPIAARAWNALARVGLSEMDGIHSVREKTRSSFMRRVSIGLTALTITPASPK
jgi:hypothetical protein